MFKMKCVVCGAEIAIDDIDIHDQLEHLADLEGWSNPPDWKGDSVCPQCQ